jgi:hypothetical protein
MMAILFSSAINDLLDALDGPEKADVLLARVALDPSSVLVAEVRLGDLHGREQLVLDVLDVLDVARELPTGESLDLGALVAAEWDEVVFVDRERVVTKVDASRRRIHDLVPRRRVFTCSMNVSI